MCELNNWIKVLRHQDYQKELHKLTNKKILIFKTSNAIYLLKSMQCRLRRLQKLRFKPNWNGYNPMIFIVAVVVLSKANHDVFIKSLNLI